MRDRGPSLLGASGMKPRSDRRSTPGLWEGRATPLAALAVGASLLFLLAGCTSVPEATVAPTPASETQDEEQAIYPGDWVQELPVLGDPSLTFDHLAPEDGLSQSVVAAIAQDPRGFIWLGTQDGLNRYDGTGFRVFRHDRDDLTSLTNSFVSSLLVDHEGVLWVGTNGGLDRYDPQTESFIHYRNDPNDPNTLGSDAVTTLAEDSEGNLWISTLGGLSRLDAARERFTRFEPNPEDPNTISSTTVNKVYVDHQDIVWIGTEVGLDRFDPDLGMFGHFRPDPDHSGNLVGAVVAAIVEDPSGTLWVGTNAGLNRYDPRTGRFVVYDHDPNDPDSLSDNTVTFLFVDSRSTLWIGTNGGGVDRFHPGERRFLHARFDPTEPASLASDGVATLFEDATGLVWIGTFGGGADRYDPRRARFVNLRRHAADIEPAAEGGDLAEAGGLSDNLVWTIEQDGAGSLWVGTATGGLNRADPGGSGFRHYRSDVDNSRTISSDQVFRVHEDRNGVIWIGTDAGLDRYDRLTDSFTRFPVPPTFQILEAKNGTFWLGTAGWGLQRLVRATGETEVFVNDPADPQSLSANFMTAMVEDADGKLWLGTFTAGLNLFDPETGTAKVYRSLQEDPGTLPTDLVISLHIDSRGTLWVGTSAGLARFNREDETFTTYAEAEGLKNAVIYEILEDDDGRLWLSTNGGLTRLDPETEAIRNFDLSDGLGSVEYNQAAGYKGDAGELYFGGIDGITVFHPDEITDDPAIPPVTITDFYLFNERVPIGGGSPLQRSITESPSITLDYRDDFLAFDYAALNYRAPEENQYAYYMEGFDPDWNEVENRTFASYTGIPPGDYVFRVRASNSDGVWNDEGASLRIVIPPPFWQTTWFAVLVIGAAVGAVAGGVSLRLRWSENRRRELERLVDERTQELRDTMEDLRQATEAAQAANRAKSVFLTNVSHELRTPLNAIIGFSQLMLRSAATGRGEGLSLDQREDLHVILRSGEHLLGLINDVLDLSKIESGQATLSERAFDLLRVLQGLEEMFRLRSEQKGLTLDFEMAPELPRYIIADEGKIRQIFMNLIGNAVKFTDAGGVVVRGGSARPEEEAKGRGRLRLAFEVQDSGPGLTQEELDSIFIPFIQSVAGIESQEGTGLGLSISQQFARLMGGDVTATSEPGKGSLFRFEVLVRRAEKRDVLDVEPTRLVVGLEPGQPETRMLIVDDSEVNRKLMVRLFEPLGLQVREAANGVEALEIWESWSPHLVWMDMRMPVMDGYQATRQIKSTTKGQGTVVIALTASALEEDRAVILSEGCDDYVRKPFREIELFDMITKHLGLKFQYQEVSAEAQFGLAPDREVLILRLSELPAEWIADLRRATLLGYPEMIAQLLEAEKNRAPEVVRWLDELAATFDHQAILDALREAEALRD